MNYWTDECLPRPMNGLKEPFAGRTDRDSGRKLSPFIVLSIVVHLVIASLLLSATFNRPSSAPMPAGLEVRLEAPKAQQDEDAARRKVVESEKSKPATEAKTKPKLRKRRSSKRPQKPRVAEISTPTLPDAPGFEYPYYLNMLRSKLSDAWLYPAASGKKVLRAKVAFRINRNGRADRVRLQESSKSQVFDRSALRAVEAAAPFPPLPDGYKKETLGTLFVAFEYHK